ncbi:hypothetical protein ACGF3K_32595 [Streptomyces sp. NPDC047980]|uniref:DUF7507 domain-containing protein n=1 Tax=Streptomyces sp. NPDC047980 TaxID=3365494 RepID=UPI003712D3C1
MFVVRPPDGSDPAPVVARAVSRTRRCWSALLGATLLLGPVPAFPAAAAQGTEAPWKVREATGRGTQASAGGPSAAAAGLQPPSSVPPPGAPRQTGHKAAQRAALPLDCSGSTIYALQNGASASDPGTLLALDAASLAGPTPTVTASVVSRIPQGGQTNALGVLPGGTGAYLVNRTGTASSIVVHGYDAASGTWTRYAGTTPGNGVVVVAGAIDPVSRIYYYAALGTGTSTTPGKVSVYGFDTETNTAIPGVIATFDLPITSRFSANGDIAFDASGNLYIVTSANSSNNAAIGVVRGPLPTTGSATGVALTDTLLTTINNPQQRQYNGIAFNNDGELFIQFSAPAPSTATYLQAVNPNNGALIGQPKLLSDTTFASVDLGACSTNPTLTLRKNIVGRFASSTTANDQFALSITGGGVNGGNTATTTGSTNGVQTPAAGPVIGVAGTTYTLAETAANGGSLDNYDTTYACVDTANANAPVTSGTADSFALHFPATEPGGSSPRILCTFTNTPDAPSPSMTLTKSAEPETVTAAGQLVEYAHVVTNTGNVTLTGVDVTETAFSGTGTDPDVSCPGTTLAPGQSMNCTATYTTTQADINTGRIDNTARATGTPPTGPAVTTTDDATVTADQDPSISLVKTVVGDDGPFRSGEVLTYTYLVRNTGNVTLSALDVNDVEFSGSGPDPEIECPDTALAPGETVTCTATYTVTQADVDAGRIENTAVATGTPPGGTAVESNESTAVFTPRRTPAISLAKSASPSEVTAAGQQVDYALVVTNTGNVTLDDVGVEETAFNGSGPDPQVSCPEDSLTPGRSMTCTASYTVTQADVDRGTVANTAVASGTPAGGGPAVTATASDTVTADRNPSLRLSKSAEPETVTAAGQLVEYAHVVTNTGNVTLTGIDVTETAFSGTGTDPDVSCPGTTLAPGQSMNCTATYTTTQADINTGRIDNTARATGTPPTGPAVTTTDDATVTADQDPSISLVKTVVGDDGPFRSGEVLTYTFLVTNTGNVSLTGAELSDIAFSGSDPAPEAACPGTALAPGQTMTCTATYTLTQADVDSGSVTNTARATGTPPAGAPVASQSSALFTPRVNPALALTKTGEPVVASAVGQLVTYTFLATNTGNVTLTGVDVAETSFSGSGARPQASCPAGPLAPGASVACTASYVVSQADFNTGRLTNTAVATAEPPTGPAVTTPPAGATVTMEQAPELTLTKSASPSEVTAAGQEVAYTFVVTNTGNVTLTAVDVSETAFSGTGTAPQVSCPGTTLAPGQSMNCTAEYTTTQADINAGAVTNGAAATGTPPAGPAVTATATDTVTALQDSSLSMVKTVVGDGGPFRSGEVLTYSYLVRNTGNVSVSALDVRDLGFTGSGPDPVVECPVTALAPGASVTCTATYTVTQADVDAGRIENTAVATGTPPGGATVDSNESTAVFTPRRNPALSLSKSASPSAVTADGQGVHYTLVVTNTGNVTLNAVDVEETVFTGTGQNPRITCPEGSLLPGQSKTCTADYTVTQADVNAGAVANTAVASGTPTGGGPAVTATASDTVTAGQDPALALVKTATPAVVTGAGQRVDYRFTVTNTGNTTLTDVTVTEPVFTGTGPAPLVACPEGPLAPGQSRTCTAAYTVTQADVGAGALTNAALATGTPPTGPPVTATADRTVIATFSQTASLTVVKTADPTRVRKPGAEVEYSFVVTNTGSAVLQDITVDEVRFTGSGTRPAVSCPRTSLAAGERMTCTATYTVTGEDIRKGSVRNTVTASGTPSGGPPVTSLPSSAEVTTSRGHGHHDGHREPGRPHQDHEGPHKPHDPHGRPDGPHGDGHHEKRPRQAA